MRRRSSKLVVLLLLLTASAGSATPAGAGTAAVLEVRVSPRAVVAPAEARPGVHQFRVTFTGAEGGLLLIRPRAGFTLAQYRAAARKTVYGSAAESRRAHALLAEQVRYLGGAYAKARETVVLWQRLDPGRVWLASSRLALHAVQLRVGGTRLATRAPSEVATVALTDSGVAPPASLPPSGVLRVRNQGAQVHSVGMVALKEGKTLDDARAYVAALRESGGVTEIEDPVQPDGPQVAVTSLTSERSAWVRYALPPGHYLIFCLEYDLRTGTTHLEGTELGEVYVS